MNIYKITILFFSILTSGTIFAQEPDIEEDDDEQFNEPDWGHNHDDEEEVFFSSSFIMIDDDGNEILMMGIVGDEEQHLQEDEEVVDDSFLYEDYDYSSEYSYYVPCSHQGNIRIWEVVKIREGLASWELPISQKGKVILSESCIEIDCPRLEMSFEIASWKKVFSNFYQLYRNNPDQVGDYMEIKQGFGRDNGFWWLMIGTLTEDGMMENTIQVTCKPIKSTVIR